MANETVRIIGLDPGLRRTGWGVITADGARLRWVAHGVVAPPEAAPFSERLLFLFEALGTILADHGCEEAAVEEVFVNINPSSTLKLGHARAAVMLAPAQRGLRVAEYSPNLIKKAVVGAGHAAPRCMASSKDRFLSCAWVIATARASAASAFTSPAVGSSRLIMKAIWPLSA
jgi:crossover junction endodeoxyribonuclease RuvC